MDAQNGTLLITNQMSALLHQLPPHVYTCPIPLFHGSTIGQHFRHILEFYTCLMEGYDRSYIDYSSRQRDDSISENQEMAISVLESVIAAVTQFDVQQELQIEGEFSVHSTFRSTYLSSLGRELQYAFDHAIHHLAIIRMGLESHFPEFPVDSDLGVAPSTLRHRKECTVSEG
jgi:uncharacterized damage-inducible protein DinB